MRAIDPAGNTDLSPASHTFTVDTVRPDTSFNPVPPSHTNDTTPTFSFTSNEAGSTFQCSLDGAAFGSCASPLTTGTLSEGSHTLQVRATDQAGNIDQSPASHTFTVDTMRPDTSFNPPPPSHTNDTTPTFSFTSNEAGATFRCSLDGAAFASCSSPFTTAALSQGSHTLQVEASDQAANTDQSPASHTFTVDTNAPAASINSGPDGPTSDNTPTFGFTSNEGGATFQCSVDNAAFAACTSLFTTANLADGAHTFRVRAIDQAGNVGGATTRNFTVDTARPDTTFDPTPPSHTNDTTPTFSFTSSETGATFQCSLDGATFTSCTSPHTTALLSQGSHTLQVRATDQAGNQDLSAASHTFTVDTAAPTASIDSGPNGPTGDNTPTFGFSSNEAGATFQCSVDGAAFTTCTSLFTTAALVRWPTHVPCPGHRPGRQHRQRSHA